MAFLLVEAAIFNELMVTKLSEIENIVIGSVCHICIYNFITCK
jgi:hypothetical protein